MAGSYGHIVDEKGRFLGTQLIDHLGDAYEALEECYLMIRYLSGDDPNRIEGARAHALQAGKDPDSYTRPLE